MSDQLPSNEQLPPGWSLDAREDESQSWLVLTGGNGEACAFSAERGSVRAQVLQDFMVARTAPAETNGRLARLETLVKQQLEMDRALGWRSAPWHEAAVLVVGEQPTALKASEPQPGGDPWMQTR